MHRDIETSAFRTKTLTAWIPQYPFKRTLLFPATLDDLMFIAPLSFSHSQTLSEAGASSPWPHPPPAGWVHPNRHVQRYVWPRLRVNAGTTSLSSLSRVKKWGHEFVFVALLEVKATFIFIGWWKLTLLSSHVPEGWILGWSNASLYM